MKKIALALAAFALATGFTIAASAADKVKHDAPYLDAQGKCHDNVTGQYTEQKRCTTGGTPVTYKVDAKGNCHGEKGRTVTKDHCAGLASAASAAPAVAKADAKEAKTDAKADAAKAKTDAKADAKKADAAAKGDTKKVAAADATKAKADAKDTKTKADAKADATKKKADAKADAKKKAAT